MGRVTVHWSNILLQSPPSFTEEMNSTKASSPAYAEHWNMSKPTGLSTNISKNPIKKYKKSKSILTQKAPFIVPWRKSAAKARTGRPHKQSSVACCTQQKCPKRVCISHYGSSIATHKWRGWCHRSHPSGDCRINNSTIFGRECTSNTQQYRLRWANHPLDYTTISRHLISFELCD